MIALEKGKWKRVGNQVDYEVARPADRQYFILIVASWKAQIIQ